MNRKYHPVFLFFFYFEDVYNIFILLTKRMWISMNITMYVTMRRRFFFCDNGWIWLVITDEIRIFLVYGFFFSHAFAIHWTFRKQIQELQLFGLNDGNVTLCVCMRVLKLKWSYIASLKGYSHLSYQYLSISVATDTTISDICCSL